MIRPKANSLVLAGALAACVSTMQGGTATWDADPVDAHWYKAKNWTPAIVPHGESDIATFATSNTTEVDFGNGPGNGVVGAIAFAEGAPHYTITLVPGNRSATIFTLMGDGIVNDSGVEQHFFVDSSNKTNSGRLAFYESASAGNNVVITNEGGDNVFGGIYGALTEFWYGSSAGRATVVNEGSRASGTFYGGFCDLSDYSGAENATFVNNPGTVSGAAAGHTLIQTFPPGGNLGTSTFIANAARVPGAEGGWVEMDVGTCAGTRFIANGATFPDCQGGQIYAFGAENDTRLGVATYTANGGTGNNVEGGLIDVYHLPLSDQTVVQAYGGSNGGLGGTIQLEDTDDMPIPQFEVFGNGTLDLTKVREPTMSIGSLAGNGIVSLAGHTLSVGNNNLDTTFAGVIEGSGSLVKAGTGTFTLTSASTYSDTTAVDAGTLLASNISGSATGPGPVVVNAGTLGGTGVIQGSVIVGTGGGAGAFLAPSAGANPATLTFQQTLSLEADSTYLCKLSANQAIADQVSARGVTIASGAQFSLNQSSRGRVRAGQVFIVLSNTSAQAINGTFANLPEGAVLVSGKSSYRVSYIGGDGNDFTLTAVQ